ncbi:MAG TPA: CehA/McbA family metallohydrolase [Opitutaceae bacterium]|nr:CehA/McbA family metallohydrolase [Opitutaceae bacterium]
MISRASLGMIIAGALLSPATAVTIDGVILDAATARPVPARLYVRDDSGGWHFAESAAAGGAAVRYERQRANSDAMERHVTLPAHPFRLELQPGRYTFTAERGKEFRPLTREVTVAPAMPRLEFRLERWADMALDGWYSGDTHVHRPPTEIASVMLAEDVNVVLPMLDWTADAAVKPTASDRSVGPELTGKVVHVDATHAWYPRNTEYEIFRTANRSHTLGAFLILNHRSRFDRAVFPLADVVRQARDEGALIDLEKHNWPWSIALVPVLNIDLFELGNNHHWQTGYAVKNWAVPAPAWMKLSGSGTDTERDWTLYGFQTYYALLNFGFRLRPTAGTANGVHPVPLGFSRVYVQLDEPFSYEAWMRGLSAGRSFVTTGPMLRAKADGRWPGGTFTAAAGSAREFDLQCNIRSLEPLESIELIENGEVKQRFEPKNRAAAGAYTNEAATKYRPDGTTWVAWRCIERRADGRIRFAHTAPWHFADTSRPLRPRRDEAEWIVARVRDEIARSRTIAPDSLTQDYERALKIYEGIAATARD